MSDAPTRLYPEHAALRRLVAKLEEIHEHPRFKAVWETAHFRLGPYDGPTYTEELAAAKAVLESHPGPPAQRPADCGDWRDDPSSDERWNAGVDFAMQQLCKALDVDPEKVTWDAATETVDGDVQAVMWNIIRTRFGEDFDPDAHPQPQQADGRGAAIEECAGVCDSIAHAAEIRGNTLPPQSDAQSAAYDKSESAARCAMAIRALSVTRPHRGTEA